MEQTPVVLEAKKIYSKNIQVQKIYKEDGPEIYYLVEEKTNNLSLRNNFMKNVRVFFKEILCHYKKIFVKNKTLVHLQLKH